MTGAAGIATAPEFLRRATAAIKKTMPDARSCVYEHMGDDNMHLNISQPPDMDNREFLAQWDSMNRLVHKIAHQLNGTFSAEHGISITKLDEMKRYKDPVPLALYRQIKRTLDPQNMFNPSKVNP